MWNILVVDDNFINRKLVVQTLMPYAICDVAANGNEAIVAYDLSVQNDMPYDLILLDVSMPEVDGLDVLKQIRSKEKMCGIDKAAGIPIFMLTAYTEPRNDAQDEGCNLYILKPIQADDLIAKIKEFLKES